ncbi:hypothetical protein BG22_10585 [Bifidobacterium sp. UTBIF-78]|nr:hypothetical protein BG22_10585 [Bifidobacterium sp. UTBIF-78]
MEAVKRGTDRHADLEARRVNKSTIAEEFTRNEYDSYALVNFTKVGNEFRQTQIHAGMPQVGRGLHPEEGHGGRRPNQTMQYTNSGACASPCWKPQSLRDTLLKAGRTPLDRYGDTGADRSGEALR